MGPLSISSTNYANLLNKVDTIIACATPSNSPMGLSLIRISGSFQLSSLNKVFIKSGPMGPNDDLSLIPRYSTLLNIVDPSTGLLIDQAIVVFFNSPASFTGENILEISLHGNPRIVERVIDIFVSFYKFRLAAPGEFTLRAYKNKKLSLSQVEGLDLLLHSSTQPLIEISQYMLSGNLQNEFLVLKNIFDQHNAAIDILTDFSEDIGEDDAISILNSTWIKAQKLISDFYHRSLVPLDYLLKPTIVFFGPPNAGKSTIFNALLGYNRSIVSPLAGTTRDYVKESLFMENNEFFLIDTAGIRKTEDDIEDQGIHFTFKNLQSSFCRVLVLSADNFNFDQLTEFLISGSPTLLLITNYLKLSDLNSFRIKLQSFFKGTIIFSDIDDINFSLLDLKTAFISIFNGYFTNRPIIVQRQRVEISNIYTKAIRYSDLIKSDLRTDLGVVSYEFNQLRNSANNLIGIVDADEILNYVFNNFCIGK